MPAPVTKSAAYDPPRARSHTMCNGSSGCLTRRSISTNAVSSSGAGDQRDDGRRGAPPVRLGVREAEHEREQPQCPGEHAGNVDPGAVGGAVVDQQAQRHDRGGHRDHEIDVQAPPPREHLRQHTPEQQPERPAAAGDRAEDPERRASPQSPRT